MRKRKEKYQERKKRQKAVCLPADIWVLSADWKSSGMSKKERKRELYNQAVLTGGEKERQTQTEAENERGTRKHCHLK